MKPICADCQLFFTQEKSGTYFEEGMPRGSLERWQSYKLWVGDLWKCRGCGTEIIVGVPARPIAEHYEDNYASQLEMFAPIFRVDDC